MVERKKVDRKERRMEKENRLFQRRKEEGPGKEGRKEVKRVVKRRKGERKERMMEKWRNKKGKERERRRDGGRGGKEERRTSQNRGLI